MYKLVIVRHGESIWNKTNTFTGWIDVPLSELGAVQAKDAGKILKERGYIFDIAFTSVLKRAVNTLEIILEEMGLNIPVDKSWRLNERHYGLLQGKNKNEMRSFYGEEQVEKWRRSYSEKPPAKDKDFDLKYEEIENAPLGESLKDTEERLLPYWEEEIKPKIKENKIIISAHGNSIRALIKIIENLSGEEIVKIEIPVGIPLVYELDKDLRPIKKYYLSNERLD
jgi:2,3-bisphosphoglycerate-dependent phosphoglycerate mutase